jgi:Uma2 family endonuclease
MHARSPCIKSRRSSQLLHRLVCYALEVMGSLARKLGRPATMADLEALPPHLKGEIIDGELYVQPRPRSRHASVEAGVVEDLRGPYQRGRGGPGGWWILPEPGIELLGSPEFSPDVAGWRVERLPELPDDAPIVIVPDWICEILSPSTRGYDQLVKRPFYARIGVGWLWYVDLEARTVTVSRLEGGKWVEVGVAGEDARVRLEPFDAVELDLAEWWRTTARAG